MLPTIANAEYLTVDREAYRTDGPRRGDIIAFRTADPDWDTPGAHSIKRVIGLPGELVEIRDGVVHVNGQQLSEPYTMELSYRTGPPIRVPTGHYLVLGDNRNSSHDSTTFQTSPWLPAQAIVGKVQLTE